jgi:hypothetical protein
MGNFSGLPGLGVEPAGNNIVVSKTIDVIFFETPINKQCSQKSKNR